MAFTKVTLLVVASVAVVCTASCEGGTGSCIAEGGMEGSDASQLYLLQKEFVLQREREIEPAVDEPVVPDIVTDAPTGAPAPTEAPAEKSGEKDTKTGEDAAKEDAAKEAEENNKPDCAEKPPDKKEWTGTCNPQCSYSCTNPKCEETCTPKCLAPQCQTRCPKLDFLTMKEVGCKMSCQKPTCTVECPKTGCANNNCAKCQTVCSKAPMCKLDCSTECEEVCAEPKCNFECTEPKDCPKPECTMKCQPIRGCDKQQFGNIPMKEGWSAVDAFEAGEPDAASFAQQSTSKASKLMAVKYVKAVAVSGSSELKLVQGIVSLPFE